MPTGMRHVAVAAALCGSMGGCEPRCPNGDDQIDDTSGRRKDAGALHAGDEGDDTSHSEIDEAGDDIEPETEANDAGHEREEVGDEAGDAEREEADAGREKEDAGVTPLGDAAKSCVPSAEVCDGKDNDCGGRVDDETQTWYCDADGDGFAVNADGKIESCEKPAASASCSGWTTIAPSGGNAEDCDDKTALRFPGRGFGLAAASSGDLNCDGQTETRLEFIASIVPDDYYSSTSFNICQHPLHEVLGSSDADKCDCWFSTAIAGGFVGYVDGGAVFDRSASGGAYFMRTFPCSEQLGDAIFLQHAAMIDGECQQDRGAVAVRQLCR